VRDFSLPVARRHIHPDVVVVGLGGGNFGDLYPKYQALRERVVAAFPDNPIVVLPQTIHFADTRALDRCSERLSRHHNLRIGARDVRSLELARRFTPHAMLLADVVDVAGQAAIQHFEDGPRTPGAEAPGIQGLHHADSSPALRGPHVADSPHSVNEWPARGTLHLLRRDDERAGGAGVPAAVDWDDLFPEFRWRLTFTAGLLRVAPAPIAARAHAAWGAYAAQLLVRAVETMREADRVVTDRLHGAIAARLAGRPVTLVDNTYGKLARYHDVWWRDDPSVTFVRRG
jgi:pyruvyl transferase EpsO